MIASSTKLLFRVGFSYRSCPHISAAIQVPSGCIHTGSFIPFGPNVFCCVVLVLCWTHVNRLAHLGASFWLRLGSESFSVIGPKESMSGSAIRLTYAPVPSCYSSHNSFCGRSIKNWSGALHIGLASSKTVWSAISGISVPRARW